MLTEEEFKALEALSKVRAAQMFPALEFFFFIVAILLAYYVYKKNRRDEQGFPMSMTALVLSLIAMGIGAAFFTSLWGVSHLVFAVSFAIGFVLSFIDPIAAACFLLANTYSRPWEATGMASMTFIPKTLGVLAVLSWLFHRLRTRQLGFLVNWPSRFFFLFLLWVLMSATRTGGIANAAMLVSNPLLVTAILFVLISNATMEEGELQLIEQMFFMTITGVLAHAICMTVLREDYSPSVYRLDGVGMTGNANDLAALVTQALPLCVIPILSGRGRGIWRGLAFLAAPVLILGLLLAASRGAILAVCFSGLIYFAVRSANPRKVFMKSLALLPILMAAFYVMNSFRNVDDIEGSTESRWSFLVAGVNMAIHNPIFGVGFSNFPKLFESYALGGFNYEWGERTAHSSWILALAELGFPGFLFFAGLVFTVVQRAWRIRHSHPEFLPAVMGYMVAMTFLSHTYTFFPYVFFAFTLSADKLVRMEKRTL